MKKSMFVLVAGIIFLTTSGFANNGNGTSVSGPGGDASFVVQEEVAQFPGGEMALQKYVQSHFNYPTVAKQQGIEGKVIVSVNIDENGKVENINIIQGIGGGCDEEVVRVLTEMPNWAPTIQAGHNIKTKKIFSFNFKL